MPLLQHSLSSIHVLFTVGPPKGQSLLFAVQKAIALQVMLLQSMSILFRLDLGDFDECFGGLVLCNQSVRVDGQRVNNVDDDVIEDERNRRMAGGNCF